MLSLQRLTIEGKQWMPLAASVSLALVLAADTGHCLVQLHALLYPKPVAAPEFHVARSLRLNGNSIADAHLFGKAATPASTVADALPTKQALTLTGTLASADPSHGSAIIAADGRSHLWAVGDHLTGDSLLHEVYPDHVILEHNGVYETLLLPLNRSSSGVLTAASVQPTQQIPDEPANIPRDAPLTSQPREFSAARHWFAGLSAQRVMTNGQFDGMRLHPQQRYKREYGLRDGDVLKGINGVSLEDPDDAARQLQYMRGQVVTMAIERNGAIENVSVDLNVHTAASNASQLE